MFSHYSEYLKHHEKTFPLKHQIKELFHCSYLKVNHIILLLLNIFFRLLKLFEIFKGKYCEILKFYFCIRNDCKTSFNLLVLKLWQKWPQENEGQKKRKIMQNFFVLAV